MAVVTGMGGVGKTELAIQYARQYLEHYPGGICWVKAKEFNLESQLIAFAQVYLGLKVPQELEDRPLNLEQQVAWCWQHWGSSCLGLIVLDDVTDLTSFRSLLPPLDRFRVLVTTRQRQFVSSGSKLCLDVLAPEEAIQLLTAQLSQVRIDCERQTAQLLCEWLGYLPLGLELVGRYVDQDPDFSLAEMLEQLKQQNITDEALDLDEAEARHNYPLMTAQRGVKAAFEISWQELDPTVANIAQFLGLFAADDIPWALVATLTEPLGWEKKQLRKARRELLNLHLIQRVSEGIYQLHPLIREFLRLKITESKQVDEFKYAFTTSMVALAETIPPCPTLEHLQAITPVIPHLVETIDALDSYLSNQQIALPFIGLARLYEVQGLYTLAEPWHQKCLSAVQNRFGPEHTAVADSLTRLALLYLEQGRYSQAEPLFQHALDLRQQLLNDHPAVADSLSHLGELYYSLGDYDRAEVLFQQGLEMRQRLLGDHPDLADSLNNLAALYYAQGRYTEAEPLYQHALRISVQVLEEGHPDVATSQSNLAALYKKLERYPEAKLLYQQALDIRRAWFGDDHLAVAESKQNLASLYYTQGIYGEAESLFLEALEMRQSLLGNEHPSVAQSLNDLAALYETQSRYSEAEPLYQHAIELWQHLLGDEHPHVAISLNNLAMLYTAQQRYGEAEPLYVKAVAIAACKLGDCHPITVKCRKNLAELGDRL